MGTCQGVRACSYCCSNKTIHLQVHLPTKKGNILLEQSLIKSDGQASSKKDRPRISCNNKQEKAISRPSGKNLMAFYDVARVSGRFCNWPQKLALKYAAFMSSVDVTKLIIQRGIAILSQLSLFSVVASAGLLELSKIWLS